MTIQEAIEQRIPRIRSPKWKDDTYIRLPLMEEGSHGPWAELYARFEQTALDIPVGSQKIGMWTLTEDTSDEWEVYEGPVDPAEQDNYAKIYAEK